MRLSEAEGHWARALILTGLPPELVPVFVIFVPSAPGRTCDATW